MSDARPRTIPEAVIRAAAEFGDADALVDGPVRLSWRDVHAQVRQVAQWFVDDGLQAGDRVAVWAPNTYHWPIIALGVHYAGGVLVPINTRFTAHEALEILQRTRAVSLVVVGEFLGTDRLAALQALAADGGVELPPSIQQTSDTPTADQALWTVVRSRTDSVGFRPVQQCADADARAAAVDPDDLSDILFTSGTTGRSKGVMSAHTQALGVAAAWAECGRLDAADRYLIINPFFHSFGYKAGILVCVLTGATIVPQSVFDVGRAMELVAEHRVSVLPGPPTIYQTMLDHPERDSYDLGSLRLAVTGAATVPVALVERMQTELTFTGVLTAYGLTEAVVATMCRPDDAPATIARTSGRATAGFEVRIGEAGEILLRGPNVMRGYLDDPAATAEALDADGWLHTGDVGVLDDDGYLTITDRLKDMYICGGFNVYPAEVEQTLARLDGVAESVVIGVADPRLGEVGKAFVVLRPGASLTESQVIEFSRERLANYKVPRHVEFRTDLPRNPAGKPLKRVLREETR